MSIEKNITKLETMIEELENDPFDLDTAVKKYGQTIKLAAETMSQLSKVEEKITLLQKDFSETEIS